jgi:hypothetical protein
MTYNLCSYPSTGSGRTGEIKISKNEEENLYPVRVELVETYERSSASKMAELNQHLMRDNQSPP